MASVPVENPRATPIHLLGQVIVNSIVALGDQALFAQSILRSMLSGLPRSSVMTQSFYEVGVRSIPVVMVTGLFIGMVLAVQG